MAIANLLAINYHFFGGDLMSIQSTTYTFILGASLLSGIVAQKVYNRINNNGQQSQNNGQQARDANQRTNEAAEIVFHNMQNQATNSSVEAGNRTVLSDALNALPNSSSSSSSVVGNSSSSVVGNSQTIRSPFSDSGFPAADELNNQTMNSDEESSEGDLPPHALFHNLRANQVESDEEEDDNYVPVARRNRQVRIESPEPNIGTSEGTGTVRKSGRKRKQTKPFSPSDVSQISSQTSSITNTPSNRPKRALKTRACFTPEEISQRKTRNSVKKGKNARQTQFNNKRTGK